MRSTTRARLAMCRGKFVSIDAEIEAKRRQLGLADDAPESKSAPAGATTQENPMPKIKTHSIVHHVSESYPGELGTSVRDVAREAARQWGNEHVAKFSEAPEQFGQKVAEVYLAAAADLSEGFESGPEAAEATA